MAFYERPAILASYSVAELTAAAALCVGYADVPVGRVPTVGGPPVGKRPVVGPQIVPAAGATAISGGLLGSLAAGAMLCLGSGYALLRRAAPPTANAPQAPLPHARTVALEAVSALICVMVGALLIWSWLSALMPPGTGG